MLLYCTLGRISVKYFIPVLLSLTLLAGVDQKDTSNQDLTCQITAKAEQSCTPVLSLKSGKLTLDAENTNFALDAEYEACFEKETVEITGQYEKRDNNKTQDIELLAKQMVTAGEEEASTFPQTIGLISLDTDSQKGYFVDIRAIILAYGKSIEELENADVECQATP